MCCNQAALALPAGGVPYCQRASPVRLACHQSLKLKEVERRVGQDEVGPQIGELVVGEGVAGLTAQVEVDAADGQVHRRQAPGGGVRFLPVDGHVADLAAMRFDEFFALHEHAARSAAGVVDLAMVRRQHGHQRLDDAARRVELAAALAFGAGEHAQEVFLDLAQHVARFTRRDAEADGGHQVHQLTELAVWQLGAGKALVQDALELGVLGLDDRQRFVDALADVGLLTADRRASQRAASGTQKTLTSR